MLSQKKKVQREDKFGDKPAQCMHTKGVFTLVPKKTLLNCQNFGIVAGRISYIVTKIWQQTKYSHFFLTTLPKFSKVENGIKVNRPENSH